jgi:beta-aspartyl-peptidase (threonine type)
MMKGTVGMLLAFAAAWVALPVLAQEPQAPIDRMVAAERLFASTSAEKGIRASFLEFFSEDGVDFRPHPVKTKKVLSEKPPDPSEKFVKLEWEPDFADVSAEGDIGYTTGPYKLTDTSGKDPVTRYGTFFSVWRREKDGQWKVILDAGTGSKVPPATLKPTLTKGPAHKLPFSEFLGWDHQEKRDLGRLDGSTGSALASDKTAACERLYAPDVRLLRDGSLPVLGRPAACAELLSLPVVKKWETLSVGLARSGDLGFSYGRFERDDCQKGYFVRVYRRRVGTTWQIAAEVERPRPDDPPATATPGKEASSASNWGLVIHSGAGDFSVSQLSDGVRAGRIAGMKEALQAGYRVLACGGSSLDAVQKAVEVMEDSPFFNAGKGAVFTSEGTHELDAAIMDGTSMKAGAVAGLKHVKNPVRLSRLVMDKSPHVLMVGDGAEAFARQQPGIDIVTQEYFDTEEAKKALEKAREKEKGAVPVSQGRMAGPADEKFGTVGAVALDKNGHLAAATSTGGMTNKRFGRVGDVPVIGAGTYANAGCAVSATGHGEYFIRYTVAHDICARMQYQKVPIGEAAKTVVMDVLQKAGGGGGVIAMDGSGNFAMEFNTTGMGRGHIGPDGKPVVMLAREDVLPAH